MPAHMSMVDTYVINRHMGTLTGYNSDRLTYDIKTYPGGYPRCWPSDVCHVHTPSRVAATKRSGGDAIGVEHREKPTMGQMWFTDSSHTLTLGQ